MIDPRITGLLDSLIPTHIAPDGASSSQGGVQPAEREAFLLDLTGHFLNNADNLSIRLRTVQEAFERLQQENERLQLENSELKGRISAQPHASIPFIPGPASSSSTPSAAPQPNLPLQRNVEISMMEPHVVYAKIKAGEIRTAEQFHMLTNTHWEQFPLSEMSAKKIQSIFPNTMDPNIISQNVQRFQLIDPKEVHSAITSGKISVDQQYTDYLFDYLSGDQLHGLPLSKLEKIDVVAILSVNNSTSIPIRLLAIGGVEVYRALLADKLNDYRIAPRFPNGLLPNLPLIEMSGTQIQHVFPEPSNDWEIPYHRERMGLIKSTMLKAALGAGKLEGYLKSYIPQSLTQ